MNNLQSSDLKSANKNRETNHPGFADEIAGTIDKNLREPSEVTQEDFYSFLTHNIRNPFGTLLGFSEMLKMDFDEMDDSEKKFFVDQINSTAKNLFDAFENFVNWTYLTNENFKIDYEIVDLYEVVLEEVQKLKNLAKEKDIQISIDEVNDTLKVKANRNLIALAVKNLLVNAIKYSGAKTNVNVKFTTDPEFIYLHIEDSGKGIDPAVNLLSYEGVIKAANENKEKSIGLGLILTDKIIKIHNGKLWYESTPEGSTFSFSLPKFV